MEMGAKSGHIIFPKGTEYKDLVPIFDELMMTFLKETNQVGDDEDFTKMLIKTNLHDLEKNRKPEGYNRNNRVRMIFPIPEDDKRVKFYVYRTSRSEDIVRVTELLSSFLREHGFDHEVRWDEMLLYTTKERKRARLMATGGEL